MVMQHPKVVPLAAVSGSSGNTATFAALDTLAADQVTLAIWGTSQSATTQAATPLLKIQESDSTSATTFVDVVGLRGGSAAATNVDFVVGIGGSAATSINTYQVGVDLRARKRYLSIVVTPFTTQTFNAVAIFSRLEQSKSADAAVLSLIEG